MTGKIFSFLLIFVLFALVLPTTAATLSIGTATVTNIGDTATIDLVLDQAPTGISGYNMTVTLSDPAVAELLSVTFPSWAGQKANGTLPADSAWIKAADLSDEVTSSSTNILLATIRIRGDASGSTPVTVTINQLSDDVGSNMFPTLSQGTFTVDVPPPAPVAAFTASPQSGNTPLSVQFTDLSTGTGISAWAWDFNNDGTVDSTVQSPSYSYASAGTYSVNLTVTNAGGSNSKIETNYITVTDAPVPAPVAAFSASPQSGNAPLSVQFTDLSTGTGISAWAWDFNNDGTIDSTVQSPSYSYASAGTYSVNLTVTNGGGADSEVKTDYIVVSVAPPAPPVANFNKNVSSGTAPLAVQFTDTSTGSPTSWAWDFQNDGTIDSTVQNPVFVYNAAGTYDVNLTVANAGGNNSRLKTTFITVTGSPVTPPVVNFIGDNREGPAPLTVNFIDQSTNNPTAWAWDFQNDGTIDSTSQNATFTYTTPGIYQVNLTASNAGGSSFRLKGNYINVTGSDPNLPGTDFTSDVRNGVAPLTVHFTDLTTGNPTAWAWDFQNDGIIDSTVQNATYTFTIPGTYQVNLTATNTAGSKSRLKANYITVTSPTGPVLSITPVSPVITTGSTRQYQIVLSSAPTGIAGVNVSITLANPAVGRITAISMPAWGVLNKTPSLPSTTAYIDCVDIGQQVQTGATNIPLGTVTITGDAPGISAITLGAIEFDADDGGIISPAVQNGQITVYTPVTANFAANITAGNLPLSVQFTDLSTGSDISSRAWDFNNDGVIDNTETNPICIFNTPGRYTVNLTVSNAFSSDFEVKTNYIVVTRLVEPFPGLTNAPTDPDFDGLYEDINGNGRLDFDDVVMFYWNMQWIRDNSSVGIAPFDFNQNGRIDYDDVVALYQEVLNS